MDKIADDIKILEDKIASTVGNSSKGLYGDLVLASPVDTGNYRKNWRIHQKGKLKWRISNPVEYASILWRGRRTVNGKTYGSLQWPNGGGPMLAKFNIKLARDLDKIVVR